MPHERPHRHTAIPARGLAIALLTVTVGAADCSGSPSAGAVLKIVEVERDGLRASGVTSVTVSPDGKHLYAAGSDGAIAVFSAGNLSGPGSR